jgi:ParB-like nuclease domain
MKPDIQIWKIERLKPYPLNSKKHDPSQVARIAKSILEFGWTQPIVVDKDGVIIAGHGRRLAAIELKQTDVPVWVRSDLDDQQVRALRLADNRVAEGGLDTELFRQELATLEFDLTGIFDAKELEFAVADLGSINMDAFISDVGAAVDAQETATRDRVEKVAEKSVPVARVLGFKDIKGANQLAISRFMSKIEEQTGLKGEDALVAFADAYNRK